MVLSQFSCFSPGPSSLCEDVLVWHRHPFLQFGGPEPWQARQLQGISVRSTALLSKVRVRDHLFLSIKDDPNPKEYRINCTTVVPFFLCFVWNNLKRLYPWFLNCSLYCGRKKISNIEFIIPTTHIGNDDAFPGQWGMVKIGVEFLCLVAMSLSLNFIETRSSCPPDLQIQHENDISC